MPIRVLADVAAFFVVVESAGSVDLNYAVVRLNAEIGIAHIRQHLATGQGLLFLSLYDRVTGLGDGALVAVENRERNTKRETERTDASCVRVVTRKRKVLLAVGLGESVLAIGGRNPQLRRAQI